MNGLGLSEKGLYLLVGRLVIENAALREMVQEATPEPVPTDGQPVEEPA